MDPVGGKAGEVTGTRIRFTITDHQGAASFIGPCHAIKMLVAACSQGARTIEEVLDLVAAYDDTFARQIVNGLRVFDEHNLAEDTASIERSFAESSPVDWPPFRVYNDVTRDASTQPAGAGLIIFNLPKKRIVQVQNSYAEIQRKDRGRLRQAGRPVRRLYHYDLPNDWSLVP